PGGDRRRGGAVTVRGVGALWMLWCAFRDACCLVSLAIVVPVAEAPAAWAIVAARLPVALASAWGLATGRRWAIPVALAYLTFVAIGLFVWFVVTDPNQAPWGGAIWSWPVMIALAWTWRR